MPHITLGDMNDLKHLVGQRVEGGRLELKVVGARVLGTPWPVRGTAVPAPAVAVAAAAASASGAKRQRAGSPVAVAAPAAMASAPAAVVAAPAAVTPASAAAAAAPVAVALAPAAAAAQPRSQPTANDPESVRKLMTARDNALAELQGQLVGVEPVKRQLQMLCETAIATERRELLGIERRPVGNHMLFLGNPGTGKSTVAEIVARLLHRIGAVPTAKLSMHENARSALCGTTLGSTAHQTKEVLLSAMCTGLKWENVGPTPPGKPEKEDFIECPGLAKSLARSTEITPTAWDKFNITDLRSNHFILVKNDYYRPVQEGGTLMLDEAYSLLPMKGGEDYSTEAITQLVALADKLRGKLVIILAGYWEQPNNRDIKHLLQENSGLDSRFPIHNRVHFPDYEPADLFEIAGNMMHWHENKLDDKDDGAAHRALSEKLSRPLPGNARDVRSILEAAMRNRDVRIAAIHGPTRDDLTILKAEDFTEA